RTTAQPRARTPGHKRDLFVTTDADDGLHFRGGLGQQNRQRHDAKIGQPVAFIGVQLAGFGNQTPANNGAELIEDTRFHGVLARELSAWFPRPSHSRLAGMLHQEAGCAKVSFCAADKTVYNRFRFSEAVFPRRKMEIPTQNKTAAPKSQRWGSLPAILMTLVTAAIVVLAWSGATPTTPWAQGYDPLGHWWLSTIFAALPIIVLLGTLAIFRTRADYSAMMGLVTALLIAVGVFHMPVKMASITAIYGASYGLFPIGWIILNVIFLYRMTLQTGRFKVLQESMTGITQDTRLQLLLIAFSFGAFFEGASGFGTPVAVTAAILIGLGFKPLQASGLSLIANTAPVAYGALGTPIIALAAVTGYSEFTLGAQVGRILPFFSVLVPFWLVWAYAGYKGMKEIWPAVAVAGVTFAIPQFLVSNFHGPWLTDIIAAVVSMFCLIMFLKVWRPKTIWGHEGHQESEHRAARGEHGYSRGEIARAWLPWLVLSVFVFCWGTYTGKK